MNAIDTADEPILNLVRTKTGKVRPVCEFCGKLGRAVEPERDGEPGLDGLARGWWSAPYPPAFEHRDGSIGSTYECPACHALPLPRDVHPDRRAARQARSR